MRPLHSEFVRGRHKRQTGQLGNFLGHVDVEPGGRVDACADSRAAKR